jgi:DNA-binding LacI/PurR family transcriptional regulator
MQQAKGAEDPVPAGRVRLIDVARLSGVTKSAASRVLNDDSTFTVRPETRQRVWDAARELGYKPHAGAQALAGAQTRALALLTPDLTNPVYSRIVRGAYRQARARGYVVLLAEDSDDQRADESFADLVESGRVDGLLIASARPTHGLLSSSRLATIPHVFVNREVAGSGRNVGMDLAAASQCALAHLHDLGHRRIGHISGPSELEPARARADGFLSRGAELGLTALPIEWSDFSEAGGAEAAERLLRTRHDITAVYTSTLPQAVGAMHAIRKCGMRIPQDVSIVAYDDLPLADFLDPPLTTVAMPLVELGAAAVDAVLAQLRGEDPADVRVATLPRIVVRQSTCGVASDSSTIGSRSKR